MKNVLLVLFLVFLTVCTYGQGKRDFDFIIVIDETIVTSLSNPKLLIKKENELLSSINISFKPGNLSIDTEDYNLIVNSNDDLYLKFDYYDYSRDKHGYFRENGRSFRFQSDAAFRFKLTLDYGAKWPFWLS
ncbi:hypothetical protein [Pedobacter psychrodurus]|uniref:hypothetical protein n=1 Tax=Pedobacter psychrodurus TaxID=2530456 RepID=UPI002931EF7F|nr:hypothetical protein [Pedobacter psychrodurus]